MRKSIGLYDPYLDTLGGGEKYVLSILKALENEFEPSIFWDQNFQKEIENKFAVYFNSKINFQPNIFHKKGNVTEKVNSLKNFDIFLYITDGSYFVSSAKRTFIYAMVPQRNLYLMNWQNKLKTLKETFFTHSKFNQINLHKWNVSAKVLYPYIDHALFKNAHQIKEKTILSVGRFFKHLHAKRQDKMIELFKKLKQKNILYKEFRLILAGGLKEEDKSYLDELIQLVGKDTSISIIINPTFQQLTDLYRKAGYFWHFTGYGIDGNKSPELVEHLGITPLEAMASGCVVFCYNAGGPKELITDGLNGFLFENEQELVKKMEQVIANQKLRDTITQAARGYIKNQFSFDVFSQNVKKLFTL